MAAKIQKLMTRRDRLNADQGEHLKQLVMEFPDLPARAVSEIIASIDGQTAARNGWTFVMLSPSENKAVVIWLRQNSKRPLVAVTLWAELFDNLRTDTGEIVLTRDELAERVGERSDNVSEIMSELESIGAISRRRQRVAGMRGPGMVKYFMNPNIGTRLTGKARDQAQIEAAPLLTLMEGGKITSIVKRVIENEKKQIRQGVQNLHEDTKPIKKAIALLRNNDPQKA